MPFRQRIPLSFTLASVRDHAPAMSGVYGISNAIEWIYIGEADNIQEALAEHLRERNTQVMKRRPTGFVFEVCQWTIRASRQDRLILEYEPTCNRHWKPHL